MIFRTCAPIRNQILHRKENQNPPLSVGLLTRYLNQVPAIPPTLSMDVVQEVYVLPEGQGKKTAELVHEYLNRDGHRDKETEELKIFSMQLLHCNLDISLLDLFSLNRRLITTVLGTLATYLVILAQFKMSNSAPVNTTTSAPSDDF